MRIFKDLFGRRTPPKPDLDNLFAVPSAAITLEAATGYKPTGVASVCYRQAEGGAFASATRDIQDLLDADGGPKVERIKDDFGFTWLVCRRDPSELSELITEVHAVNSTLENVGFGEALLCSVIVFESPEAPRVALVYLYKQGTFYPFAPEPGKRRDNAVELQLRGVLATDLPIEEELNRWMALWDAPGIAA